MRRRARRDPIYLAFFLSAAVLVAALPHPSQLAVSAALRSTILAPVLRLQTAFLRMKSMRARVEQLRAERDSFGSRVIELGGVEEENLRLRALLALSERAKARFQPANLYPAGRAAQGVKLSFVLDVGRNAGVEADAAVVVPAGLVGVVRAETAGQATGDFWTHPEFRVSAMTADGAVFGIIRSIPGTPPRMQLDGAPYQVELAPGTELLTSGLGRVFPRGIPIGRAAELTGEQAGWSKTYLVEPAVHPGAVREVMVLVERSEAGNAVGELWEGRASSGDRP